MTGNPSNLSEPEKENDWRKIAAKNPNNLNRRRLRTVTQVLKQCGARRVIDLGCGEGNLLRSLIKDPAFTQLTGVDISDQALETAKSQLKGDLPAHQQNRLQLIQGSLVCPDQRFRGYDAAALVEVIEHIEPDGIAALEQTVFNFAQPKTVIVTTPNIEYNILYPIPPGQLRDPDHRFEWTRQEFRAWAEQAAQQYGYTVTFQGIGDEFYDLGTPTQMAIFQRECQDG
ncbi:MAG: methyltransferase [Phormidesmis sp.]